MANHRSPGPQTEHAQAKPDPGTLAATRTAAPGVSLGYAWDPRTKEGVTRCVAVDRADAYRVSDGKILAAVYFPVDVDKVDRDDILRMAPLLNSLTQRVEEKFEISLVCVGHADYRASREYNLDLGFRRATNVAKLVHRYVLGSATATKPWFTIKAPRTLGELRAAQPSAAVRRPSEWTMGRDRVVTVEIEKDGLLPPVALAFEGPLALSKGVETLEVNAGGRIEPLKVKPLVVTRKDEEGDPRGERKKQRNSVKGKKNLKDDPFRAVVEIRAEAVGKPSSGGHALGATFRAIHVRTGRTLFALKSPATRRGILEDFDNQAIYRELKGPFANITARASSVLGRKISRH